MKRTAFLFLLFLSSLRVSAGNDTAVPEDSGLPFKTAGLLSGVRVYPNPFMPGSGGIFDTWQGITFDNMPGYTEIRIYTLYGEEIAALFKYASEGTKKIWDARNRYGGAVASGIYIFEIKSEAETKRGKLCIIR